MFRIIKLIIYFIKLSFLNILQNNYLVKKFVLKYYSLKFSENGANKKN